METLREAFESASASQNEPEQPVSASLQDAAATPAKQSAQAPASKRRLAGKLSTGSDASSSEDGERGSAFANPQNSCHCYIDACSVLFSPYYWMSLNKFALFMQPPNPASLQLQLSQRGHIFFNRTVLSILAFLRIYASPISPLVISMSVND